MRWRARASSGIERQEARERVERTGVVAQTLVAELGDPPEEIPSLVDGLCELEIDLEHAHEVGHLVALRVHRLEHNRRARPQVRDIEDLLDELPGLRGSWTLAEHLLEVGEGSRRVAETREQQNAEPLTELQAGIAYGALEPPLEQLRQAVPALLGGVQRVERPDRLLVRCIDFEDALVVRDGLSAIARDLLRDEGYFGEQLGATRGLRRRRDDAFVKRGEIPPLFARSQDLLEPLEGALVARLLREHPLEVGARPIGITQLLVE